MTNLNGTTSKDKMRDLFKKEETSAAKKRKNSIIAKEYLVEGNIMDNNNRNV